MAGDNQMVLARVRQTRERVIAGLSEHFAHDALDIDEFERRVTVAQTSESAVEMEALLADLPALAPDQAAAPATSTQALVPASQVQDEQTMFAIMGGSERRGAWSVPRRLKIRTMMGGAVFDFREARLPAGPVDIDIKAMMGGVVIIVPPGLAVEVNGSAIMGGFAHVNRAPATPDPELPLLRIHGLVVMGGVEVRMQLPGEDEHAARHRERRALRQARRDQRALNRQR